MSDTPGSLTRQAAAAACLTVLISVPAHAQSPAWVPPPSAPGFLTHYDFHLTGAALSSSDERFSWDTHFGGDLDVVDYVGGRLNILIDYEAVLGSEFRPFDPNQGNYALEVSSSVRLQGTEIAAVFHHVSRHLSDRPKRFGIDWNVLGVRVERQVSLSGSTLEVQGGAGKVVKHDYADYVWTGNLDLLVRRAVNARVGVFGRASGEVFGTDNALTNRSAQTGGRVEGGIRLNGEAGAIELFAGYERRIDADPVDRQAQQWGFAGFRLLSK